MLLGFSYHDDFLDADERMELLAKIRELPFRTDTFRGMTLRRTIACFGYDYVAARRSARNPAPTLPLYLASIRNRAAAIAGVEARTLEQAIIWKYPPRVGIGWHVDHRDYGPVICGVSLGAAATIRLQRGDEEVRQPLANGSLYVLRDDARYAWKHKVDGNAFERFSITFRSMREEGGPPTRGPSPRGALS